MGEPAVDPEPLEEVANGDMFQAVSDGRRVRDTIVANYFTLVIDRLNINVFINKSAYFNSIEHHLSNIYSESKS